MQNQQQQQQQQQYQHHNQSRDLQPQAREKEQPARLNSTEQTPLLSPQQQQMRHQQLQQQQQFRQHHNHQLVSQIKLAAPNSTGGLLSKGRPLSISSISSAASSGSTSSGNSSASSATQLSLTRNSSLNYGQDFHTPGSMATAASRRVEEIRRCDYLSSIESLNISQHYWNHSQQSTAQRVVTEIIETERAYVDDLEQIVTGYLFYLKHKLQEQEQLQKKQQHQDTSYTSDQKQPSANERDEGHGDEDERIEAVIAKDDIDKLFINLEDIYKFNKELMYRLEECYLNPSSVAECFVENAPGFEVYTLYCTMYPQVVSTLTKLMANPDSAQLLRERQNELNQSLPLGAYLLKPVQRILKYHILFQSLIKHTADDDSLGEKDAQLIGEAFSVMTGIACHINAMKKKHEHAIRVQEVQGLLSGWEGPDLTTLGELILEDTFKLYDRPKSSRHLFLFDNVVLITKKKRDGSLCYKGHIMCRNLMLIEKIEGQPLVFNTVPFDNPKAFCAFQARNADKKQEWCLQIKELIIKSFDVEIPVHARDILMSLTSTKTTDATCPKSSHETARALRAPNYLEKKRAKQDKKE